METVLAIDVARNADGSYRIDWERAFVERAVEVRCALSPEALARAPSRQVAGCRANVAALASDRRHYFSVRPVGGEAVVVAERAVALTGGVNFRDLGGYLTTAGTRVRWGRLFRSGHTANLVAGDHPLFLSLDIRTVCDFRMQEERAHESSELPGAPELRVLGIPPGVGDRGYLQRLFASSDDPEDVAAAIHDIMRSIVTDSAARFRPMIEALLSSEPGAVLLNCSAGKERTGIASALVLHALGVPRGAIMYDFMLSERHFPASAEIPRVLEKYAVSKPAGVGERLIMPLLETRRSYLETALDAIDEGWGSCDAFLAANYDLGAAELASLRAKYTC